MSHLEGWAGPIHPAAELFPLIEGDDFEELVADIAANGLLEPVWVTVDGDLLDGRNRVRACHRTGRQVTIRTYEGSDPVGFVVSLNLKRRHLTTGQKAMLALEVEELISPGRGARTDLRGDELVADRPQVSERERKSRERAAAVAGTSGRAVSRAKRVREAAPELAEQVAAGTLALDKAERIVRERVHVTHNSGQNEWYTPREFIEAARRAMGSLDTDPASNLKAQEWVQARTFYTKEDSGLERPWSGNVWLNPPYAQPLIGQFCDKAVHEFEAQHIQQAIVLVNNGTETRWGQRLLSSCTAVCFPTGRIKFLNSAGEPKNTPLQGQMLVYLGQRSQHFAAEFASLGVILKVGA